MKDAALRLVADAGRMMPIKLRHLIVKGLLQDRALIERYGMVYLSGLSQKLNIVRLSAIGDYGVFSSSPNDFTIFGAYARTGRWSAPMNDLMKVFFKEGTGTYVDIGANIGMTLVPIASAFPNIECHGFEPEPSNFDNLRRNVSENCSFGNVTTYQVALFNKKTTMQFELANGNLGDHRLRVSTDVAARQGELSRNVIDVACDRLDDLGIRVRKPFLAKIDTQGAEPFVFAGGERTLADADVILLEWCPYLMARLGGDAGTVVDFLERNFGWGAIEDPAGSGGSNNRVGSIADVCAFLRASAEQSRRDPDFYVDVAVRKIT